VKMLTNSSGWYRHGCFRGIEHGGCQMLGVKVGRPLPSTREKEKCEGRDKRSTK
jgi:hypothetical protein